MSSMKILNKRGFIIGPCGIPTSILHHSLKLLFIKTFEMVLIDNLEQILSHRTKTHTHLVWQVITCD